MALVEIDLVRADGADGAEGGANAGDPGEAGGVDRVAVVRLNDPEHRNALGPEMVAGLVGAFDRIESSGEVGAVVVTGAAPAFCAGANLSSLGTERRREGLLEIYESFLRIARCPLPTLAAVNGAAVGAGMNVALACDVRLAGGSARFDTRFLQLGIAPGGGHTWMLERAVGVPAAAAMVLFGEVLTSAEAHRVGLVWRTVPDEELLATAVAMAARAASAPRELARRTKATLGDVAALDDHAAAVERELEVQIWSMDQPEFAARLAALQAKITTR
jgi:enoyl-CoA hydratase